MEEDEELGRIRDRMLKDMMKKTETKPESESLLADKPIEVNDSSFSDAIRKEGLVVVDCWAAWCGPCRMVGPMIEELAKEYAGKILFGKLNVDKNQKVPLEYQIMSIPTILVFKDGKLVDRIVGAMPKKILEQRITRHL